MEKVRLQVEGSEVEQAAHDCPKLRKIQGYHPYCYLEHQGYGRDFEYILTPHLVLDGEDDPLFAIEDTYDLLIFLFVLFLHLQHLLLPPDASQLFMLHLDLRDLGRVSERWSHRMRGVDDRSVDPDVARVQEIGATVPAPLAMLVVLGMVERAGVRRYIHWDEYLGII